jgi:hypothetical protein
MIRASLSTWPDLVLGEACKACEAARPDAEEGEGKGGGGIEGGGGVRREVGAKGDEGGAEAAVKMLRGFMDLGTPGECDWEEEGEKEEEEGGESGDGRGARPVMILNLDVLLKCGMSRVEGWGVCGRGVGGLGGGGGAVYS